MWLQLHTKQVKLKIINKGDKDYYFYERFVLKKREKNKWKKIEFKEKITDKELLKIAKEGAMLQYKNGKYELYSQNGYDMLFEEEKN